MPRFNQTCRFAMPVPWDSNEKNDASGNARSTRRGRKDLCGRAVTQPEAAVAIVRAREPEDSILLMRRTIREGDSWSGQWSFPGGRCDPSDPSPLDTALRELR